MQLNIKASDLEEPPDKRGIVFFFAILLICIVVAIWKGNYHEYIFAFEGYTNTSHSKDEPIEKTVGAEEKQEAEAGEREVGHVSEEKGLVVSDSGGVVGREDQDDGGGNDGNATIDLGATEGENGSRFVDPKSERIYEYVRNYPGGRIDDNYFALLENACGGEYELLRIVIAISVAETGMGRAGGKYNTDGVWEGWNSNFWGWYAGGNRSHDPSRGQMAHEICSGVSGYYRALPYDFGTIQAYVGNDRPTSWQSNFLSAYGAM